MIAEIMQLNDCMITYFPANCEKIRSLNGGVTAASLERKLIVLNAQNLYRCASTTSRVDQCYHNFFCIFNEGTDRIRADWAAPSSVNGILRRYIVYLSQDSSSSGWIVYNSSDLLPYFTISNLTAGTPYFVRLSVSLSQTHKNEFIYRFVLLITLTENDKLWYDEVYIG
jgi:hypothetical protein